MYHHLKNSFFNSNTYIIENGEGQIIIVDPGNPNGAPLLKMINERNWKIEAVFLTHEHCDHIAGLNEILNIKKVPVYCSRKTSTNINDSKLNLSKYIDDIDAFELDLNTTTLKDNKQFTLIDMDFLFVETPGHSIGSGCFFTSDAVFTGDTVLNQEKTVLNLPTSNKKQYYDSLKKLNNILTSGIKIFPGHGEPFIFNFNV